MSTKPSELFEGENSSLKRTFDEVASKSEGWVRRFDKLYGYEQNGNVTFATAYAENGVKQFIQGEIDKALTHTPTPSNSLEVQVGMLRQWLNEDRITDPKRMVSNKDLLHWLRQEPSKEVEEILMLAQKGLRKVKDGDMTFEQFNNALKHHLNTMKADCDAKSAAYEKYIENLIKMEEGKVEAATTFFESIKGEACADDCIFCEEIKSRCERAIQTLKDTK